MMLTVKTKASKFLACLLAIVVAFGVIPVGMVFTAAAATIDGYTITLTDGTDVIDTLEGVKVTLTNDADSQKSVTATTVKGVATFDSFVEENESYTATIEAITGYDSTWSVQFTCDQQDDPDAVKNADIVLTTLDKIVISGFVTDEADKAYANAKVEISGYVTGETTTDADGKYSFYAYKGKEYTIKATANDDKYETATTTVSAPAADYECSVLKFAIKQFTVSTTVGENGTITATETVDYGSSKEITATANTGYRIDSFIVDGTEITDAKGKQSFPYLFSDIKENHSISVTFIRQTYIITFTVADNGKVTYNDGTEQTVAGGSVAIEKIFEESTDPTNPTKVTVTATPEENYRVSKVIIDDETPQTFDINDKDFSTELEMTANHTFTVEFALNEYTVVINGGDHGTTEVVGSSSSKDGYANYGDNLTIKLDVEAGWSIESIKDGNGNDVSYDYNDDEGIYEVGPITVESAVNIAITYSANDEIYSFSDNVKVVIANGDTTVEFNTTDSNVLSSFDDLTPENTKNILISKNGETFVFKKGTKITLINKNLNRRGNPRDLELQIVKDKSDSSYGSNAKGWYNPKTTYVQIEQSCIITNVQVQDGDKNTINIQVDANGNEIDPSKYTKRYAFVFDQVAPEITNATAPGWTNADSVTITGTVTDKNTDKNPSSGLSYVVWSKDSALDEAGVLAPTNRVTLDANGNFSFNSVEGEQNSTYYIYAVDLAGNISNVATVDVKIDKTNPTIENFTFSTKENNIVQDVIKFLTFGTICAETMYVTVSAEDKAISSGLKEITLYVDGVAFETKIVSNNSAVFELTQNKFKNGAQISATVVDKAGNVSDEKMYGNIVKIDNDTKPTIEITPDTAVYTDEYGKLWYAGDLSVNVTAGERNTGIRSVKIELNGTEIATDANGVAINSDFSTSFVNALDFVINTYQNTKDGENLVKVTVVNNAGISVEKEQYVYIDTTKPDVRNFEFKREGDTPLDKVLNILTFGIFFNDKVEITVTADDVNATSSIKEITLYVDEKELETKETVDNKATFTIPVEDIADNTLHFNKVISATATDNVGNITEKAVFPNTDNSNVVDSKLMIETIKPTIDVAFASAADNKNSATADTNDWYNSDVEFTVNVADANSGIKNSLIKINGTELVNEDYYNLDTKTETATYTVSTADAERAEDGSYTLEVTVTDNAGNVSDTYTKTIYKDTDKPYITGFDFEPENFVEGSETTSSVEVTEYGFYFKEDTKVTISAMDAAPSSGVKSITYYTVDKDAGESEKIVADVNEAGQIEFVIRANFKGQIKAIATDNVDNTTDAYVTPNSAVVEDADKHEEEDHIFFEKAETAYTTKATDEVEATELYATDVPVAITVVDTYSGIRSITWSVVAPYDTANNQGGTVTVNNDKTYTDESDAGWTNVETDSNLVTKMQREILVSNNSNDIIVNVKMTDRAGNTSEEEIKFSIDKTAPVIDIVYNEDSVADEENADFYKADREATITITERNFRAEDIVFAIANTDNVIPEINLNDANVWTEVENDEDPDQTTYTAKIKYTADGDYTFDIAYKDNAENAANTVEQHAFTLDKTLPVITVVYDNNDAQNGNYYKADRIATITIVEHNFDSARVNNIGFATDSATGTPVATTFPTISAWQNVGADTYVATIAYTVDSKYTFDIEFNDMAGNSIVDYTPVEFYVDKTAPTLEISGVADNSANKGTVAPIVTYSDTNFNVDAVTITLTGINNGKVNYSAAYAPITNGQTYTYANFEEIQKVDDIYTLTAKLVDMAGNETEQTITFSANRFGSVYDLTDVKDILGKYLTTEQDIVFTETNVDSLDREDILIKLTKNGTPTDLIEGVDYTVETSGGNGRWSVYKYTIKKALFAGDGRYSISVYSTDAAGNVNENIDETKAAEISFGIDKTTPVIVPIDFESNEQYDVEMKTVSIEIKDNLVLEDVKIYLNGQEIEYTVDGETYTFNIPESNDKQDVKIVVVDAAGNEQVIEVNGFTVSTNFFVRWFNDTPVFIGSMVGMVALALGITIFLVFFKKKKKNEDEE